MAKELTDAESRLLKEVVKKRAPRQTALLSVVGQRALSTEEREALRASLSEEFVSDGLRENDEPNEYGVRLDNLIGRLMHF
jgi:hypothetical protein